MFSKSYVWSWLLFLRAGRRKLSTHLSSMTAANRDAHSWAVVPQFYSFLTCWLRKVYLYVGYKVSVQSMFGAVDARLHASLQKRNIEKLYTQRKLYQCKSWIDQITFLRCISPIQQVFSRGFLFETLALIIGHIWLFEYLCFHTEVLLFLLPAWIVLVLNILKRLPFTF